MKTYRVHIIRHGQTAGNSEGRYIGRNTDFPLTDEGITGIKKLKKDGFYPEYLDTVYSSPLSRCTQTLDLIYPGVKPIIRDGFAECDFGEFEGKTAAMLKDDPRFSGWISGKIEAPPGGESTKAFVMRSVGAFAVMVEELMRDGITESLLCAHGGTIMSVLSCCGLPERSFADWMCGNGRGYTLLITPTVWMRGYKAEVIGEI